MHDETGKINGVIIDEPVRVTLGTENTTNYFYGWIKGFIGNSYLVRMTWNAPDHTRPVSSNYVEVPDDIELLLYF